MKIPVKKDTIWLDVIDDAKRPIETKVADKKIRPMNEPQKPPLSTLPIGKSYW